MTEPSPESKALRDLVTAIKKGQKPDVTEAEKLLDTPMVTVETESLLVDGLVTLAGRIRSRHHLTEEIRRASDALCREENRIDRLSLQLDKLVDKAMAPLYRKRDKLISDARSGKLTKKQFDKAIKDFFR